jgi:excisionase family DNA binding protein
MELTGYIILSEYADFLERQRILDEQTAERARRALRSEFTGKPRLITYNEAAERLGVTRLTVDRMAKSGEFFRNYKFPNGQCRIDENELDQYIADAAEDRSGDNA